MNARSLPLPEKSFFLFGPRGAGKTTWLRQRLLDEVHDLIASQPGRHRFALSGSSARKRRRAWGTYLGRDVLKDGPVDVLPLQEFQRRLAAGRLFPA